jgi:hypothetical protein
LVLAGWSRLPSTGRSRAGTHPDLVRLLLPAACAGSSCHSSPSSPPRSRRSTSGLRSPSPPSARFSRAGANPRPPRPWRNWRRLSFRWWRAERLRQVAVVLAARC